MLAVVSGRAKGDAKENEGFGRNIDEMSEGMMQNSVN